MNYLALVNRTRRECGESTTDLASFSSLSATDTRFKTWVNEAWRDIQIDRPDWAWMLKAAQFNTVGGTQLYDATATGVADLGEWRRESFRCYLAATGVADEQYVPFVDYDYFRDTYQFGNQRTQTGRPVVYTINRQDKKLVLWPTPDAIYTVVGEYYHTVTDLSATTDDPSTASGLDSRWHMLIVYRAMAMYASYEAAPEVMQRAELGARRLMNRLQFDQAPELTFGPPLA